MSEDHSNEASSGLSSILGFIAIIAVPAAMLTMLAYVGLRFIGEARVNDEPTEAELADAQPTADIPSIPNPEAVQETAPTGNTDLVALGKQIFGLNCVACHGVDAKGLKVGPSLMAPNLVGSELMIHENPDVPALVLLKGIQKEGMEYMGVMAALGAVLDDEKIAAVLTYLRTDMGNSSTPVTVEQVAAARAKFAELNLPLGVPRKDILSTAGVK